MADNILQFESPETFGALEAAREWCRERGVSYGSTEGKSPIGLLIGDYNISKWRNMTPRERAQLDGHLEGSARHGPIRLVAYTRRMIDLLRESEVAHG